MKTNRYRIKIVALVAVILTVLHFNAAQAEIPPTTIGYQGFLTDSSGTAIANATYGIKVEIYEALSGGTAVYTETHSNVSVTHGRFFLELGSGTTSDTWSTAVDFSQSLWLQLTIDITGANETLSPRVALRPGPYTRLALDVADGIVAEDKLAASLTFDDGDLLNLSNIDASGTTEGLILPQATNVSTATAEGQVSWDTDSNVLYIGTGSDQTAMVNTSGTQTLSNKILERPTVSGGLSVNNGSTASGTIDLYEDSDDGSNKVTLQAQALASDYTLTLPNGGGTDGQVLSTDGNGTLSWTSKSSGDVTTSGTQTLSNKTLTSPTINSGTLSGGAIDNATIGATTPSTGAFSTLSATGTSTLTTVDVNGGVIDATTIGATTPSTGAFTTLSATGTSTLTTVDVNGGAIDATSVGATTPSTGAFTTLSASGTSTLTMVDINGGAIDATTIGATTPSTGAFSTLSASGAVSLSNTLEVSNATTLSAGLSISNGTEAGSIALYEGSGDGNNKVTLQAGATTSDYTLTLPGADGSSGQVLSTDGNGNLAWTSTSSGDVTTSGTQTLSNKTLTSPTINSGTLSGGTIDNATVGATAPSTGAFTTLSATGTSTLTTVDVNGGAIDATTIGATTPSTGAFTILSAAGTSTLTTVDINGGAVDATTIGATTPSTGAFTTLSASGTSTLATVDVNGGAIDATSIGVTSPSTGAFTTLSASGTSTLTTVDINGGAIDATTIGATTPSTGAFSTLLASGAVSLSNTLEVSNATTLSAGLSISNGTDAGSLALYEGSGDGNNKVTLQAGATTSDYTLTFPGADGSSGQVLSTDGNGNLAWTSKSSGDVTTSGTQTLSNKTLTSPTINSGTLSDGSIDNATIGATTPSTGAFTTLSATGTSTLTTVDVNGGAIDATTIGANTPSTGAFTTFSATGASTLTTVDVNGGAVDATTIGATTPSTGAFTTLSATGTSILTTVDVNGGTIDATTIGATTPSTGAFSTLSASGAVSLGNTLEVGNATTLSAGLSLSNGSKAGTLALYEGSGNGSNKITLQAGAMTSDFTLTLPDNAGTSGYVLSTDGSGTLSWSMMAFTPASTLIYGGDSDDDFVLGSSQLADSGNSNEDARVFFDKSKGAFRAGKVESTQWDDASVGNQSLASGLNSTASGNYSIAMGESTTASGSSSTAMGGSTTASSDYATALGNSTKATGDSSTAMGTVTTASGSGSTAMGTNTTANGSNSTAMGLSTTASGGASTAMGGSTTASGDNSTALGTNTTANAYASLVGGQYNTDRSSETLGAWVSTDSLFVLGNGSDANNRSDAFVILKSGATTIDNANTQTVSLSLKNDTTAGSLALYEGSGNGSNKVTLQAGAMTSDFTLTLPDNAGTSGYVLITDGSGILSWSTPAFTTASTLIYGGDSDDDFVFGSSQLASSGNSNEDARMFFDKSKGAFRAGSVTSTQWDDANVGYYSFASGSGSTASGISSTAMGVSANASGISSTAMGESTNASGSSSTAMGLSTTASGYASTAMGQSTNASGGSSTAMGVSTNASGTGSIVFGNSTTASSYVSFVGGQYNTDRSSETSGSWVSTDSLLVLGNGSDASNRSDAFVILKSGATTIDNANTQTVSLSLKNGTTAGSLALYEGSDAGSNKVTLQAGAMTSDFTLTLPDNAGTSGYVLSTDGSGTLSWGTTPFTTASTLIYGGGSNDDFVFGSSQLADSGNSDKDARMFFDKSKGAFRAGKVTSTQWDDANVGDQSFASGLNSIASGAYSTAMGGANASGAYSTALGYSSASGTQSTAMGEGNSASGSNSTAMGAGTSAIGDLSTAMGYSTSAIGDSSTAMGAGTYASGSNSTAMGAVTTASSYGVFVGGQYNTDRSSETSDSWVNTDSLFVLGNGTSASSKSDALVVLKNGNATLAGTLTENSDIRLKQNIMPLTGALDKLMRLTGVTYEFKDTTIRPEGVHIGVVAQDIQKVFPELVSEDHQGYLSVAYDRLAPILLEGVKEQQTIIHEQQTTLQAQSTLIEQQQAELQKQKEALHEQNKTLQQIIKALAKAGVTIDG